MTPEQFAQKYQIPLATVEEAFRLQRLQKVILLTVSGKLGSGKDTVAPLILDQLGFSPAEHEFFARPLKSEVQEVITIIQTSDSKEFAAREIGRKLQASNYSEVLAALWGEVKSGLVTSSYQRTPATRTALQLWGTEVRRTQDPDYWVKKAVQSAFQKLALGVSIYVTDSRFPNEADAVVAGGGKIVRLHVSPEVQALRIKGRDGKLPEAESLVHVSETAMDDYPFPFVIDTDHLSPQEVAREAAEALRAQHFFGSRFS